MIRNKNKKAFAFLYDKYAAALYGYICKQTNDKKTADEIFQQTFFNIWNGLSESSSLKNHLLVWMLGIAKNITHQKFFTNNENTLLKLNAV